MRIRDYIETDLEHPGACASNRTPLLGSVLDSLDVLSLVAFIEEEFDVLLDDDDFSAENLRSLDAMERLIGSKMQSGSRVGSASPLAAGSGA